MGKKGIISASMVVFVFAVLISLAVLSGVANAGVSPDVGRCIGDCANGTSAIIGETNLHFVNASGVSIPKGTIEATWEGGPIIPFEGRFDSRYAQQYEGLVAGGYRVRSEDGALTTNITFSSPTLTINKIIVRGREYTKVVKGENITFVISTNLWIINSSTNISFKLVNPRGVPILIENVPLVNGTNRTTINTAQLDTGEYKISIKSDPATNNGLDTEGASKTFSVEKRSITIEADVEKQAVNKDVIFTISTTYGFTNFSLNVTRGAEANVEFAEFVYEQGAIKRKSLGHHIAGRTDEDGNYKAIAYFTEPGIYEISATDTDADIESAETVEIEEFRATVSVDKTKYYVGEPVIINGSANSGDNITVKVDDEVIKTDAEVEGFNCTWRTAGYQPGSYEIGIWVLPHSNPDSDPPDASVTVLLMQGGLSATLNKKVVALGDEFEIKGDAPGGGRVDILTISPKGGSGHGLSSVNTVSRAPGLTHSVCSPDSDGGFKDKIRVDDDADTGTYLIAVLSYGRDGVWGTSGSNNLTAVLSDYPGSLAIKTQEQIIAILKDRTINAPGSDDLLCINAIKVENPEVRLDDIEDVLLGDNIVVSGYTNRAEGSTIVITVEGPVELKPKLAFVEKDGTFNVSFSTVSARPGEYTVTASDGEGYYDTKPVKVNVITATTPLLSVKNSSGNSSTHSPALAPATATATSSQSQEAVKEDGASADPTLSSRTQVEAKVEAQPGFELIFAFAALGLAMVVWSRLKKRKK